MAHDLDDFSQLWQRHLTLLRDDFSTTSVQALPSGSQSLSFDGEGAGHGAPERRHPWDEKMDVMGDSLDEMTL
jgi:hypothetical protein